MTKQLSNRWKILLFFYCFIGLSLPIYFGNISFPYIGVISIIIGFTSGIIANLIVMKLDKLKIWYEKLVRLLISGITNKVKKDLESYDKIKDKNLRNMMIKSYIETVFENTRSDIWTKIIMIVNLIVICLNLFFLLISSWMSNINPIYTLFLQERIKEVGVATVAKELGVNYTEMTKAYFTDFMKGYLLLFEIFYKAIIISVFGLFFFGSMFYFIVDSAKKARLKAINEVLVELYKKNNK